MTVTVAEAQARLPDLLAQLPPGETLTLTQDDRPVADLVARTPPAPPGPPGPEYWDGVRRLREAVRVEFGSVPPVIPGTGDWADAEQAARELRESGFDFDVYRRNREAQERAAEEEYREWQERQRSGGHSS